MTWIRKEGEPNILGIWENLCWKCQKSIGGCSWSKDFIPIEGWDAEPDRKNTMKSYKIRDCPAFERRTHW